MKVFSERSFEMKVHESGFVEFLIRKEIALTAADIWLSRDLSTAYLPGKKYYVLTEAEDEFKATADAKTAAASKEYAGHVSALALCSNNSFLKILGNLFISINRPVVKTRFFDDREKARQWLHKCMQGY